ncbi:hypothetical protein VTK73DRAFT_9321 [Phialemonium thermophilum]|uniref:Tyrosinase copper-binding domain-containing protein n=1 Tax=Phialemonium thermophilum TaxID=223376 RepID=A0ABR3W318_9PEZI
MRSLATYPFVFVLLAMLSVVAYAVPKSSEKDESICVSPKKRRSWHTLSDDDKRAYLDAEVCLMSKPSVLGLRASRTRFDDFQSVHVLQAEIVHFVGQFLPFHRLFVWAHELALETACGYTAGQPSSSYWDQQLDTGAYSRSVLFVPPDPALGFGGDGANGTLCIQGGPFADYTNPLGPGYAISDHCIQRRILDAATRTAAPAVVARCLNTTSFVSFWPCIEGGPHTAGHAGVGAEMVNPISSPGDPVFFLHHAWLDKLWADWQAQDPAARLADVGGNNREIPIPGSAAGLLGSQRPADVPEPQIVGDPANVTTLDHVLQMHGVVENRTIAQVMDIRGFLCYDYD